MLDTFPFDRRQAADLLADPDTSATLLHLILLSAYGDELYGAPEKDIAPMDPVECWVRVQEDFRVTVPESNENKINGLMFAVSTDAFYDDPLAFRSICSALYSGDLGDLVDGVLDDLTVPEMLWSVYEVELNRSDYQEFAASVEAVMDEVISTEAEDREDLDPEDVVPYYEKFVAEQRNEMLTQMRKIGVSEDIIKRVIKEDLTPANAAS